MCIRDSAVVIPARDEAAMIESCLRSVARSLALTGLPAGVVVVDDRSRDDTAARATDAGRRFGLDLVVVQPHARTIGAVRHRGALAAIDTFGLDGNAWLLSTDADTLVPESWAPDYVHRARLGLDAVAGVVDLRTDVDVPTFLDDWRRGYRRTLSVDDHPHVHAANLGVRVWPYLTCGGFPPVDRAEDVALWCRLRDIGARVVADPRLVVDTSGRIDARVTRGFGAAIHHLHALDALDTMGSLDIRTSLDAS